MAERTSVRLVFVLCIILWPLSLEAQTGHLAFEPEHPQQGQQVVATYRSATWKEPHLLLRARLRTADDGRDNDRLGSSVVAVLHRQAKDTYTGRFELPADVVYGVFAVEDRRGGRVDSYEGRFWDLIVYGPNDRPLLQGLEQRFNDLLDRDDRPLLDLARTMVDLYPDRLESWSTLRAAEDLLGEEGARERRARHQQRAHYFDRLLNETRSPDPDQSGYLFSYASLLGEQAVADRWRDRLKFKHPGHYFALVDPVYDLRRVHSADPTALVRGLDSLWGRASDRRARRLIVGPAFAAALRTENPETILLWADRYALLDPHRRASIASALAGSFVTREEGIQWVREEVGALDPPSEKQHPVGATKAEVERAAARRRAALQTDLGRALLETGRTAEAIAVLEHAAASDWNTERFRILGEARLASGDTLGAMRAFALASADPGMAEARADSLRRSLGATTAAWGDALGDAKAEMVRRTMSKARSDPVPSIDFGRRDGQRTPLRSLLGESATVLVFWSRYCSFSHQAMPAIVALARRLRDEGIPLLAVTHDPLAEAEEYLTHNAWDLDVRHDGRREAARALGNWATPQYFVLDGSGRLRFAFTSLTDIPRQVMALQMARRP